MHCLQSILINMRVNLRGADVAVAQQFLHDAKIGAAADEVSGEAMPQGVWRNGF